MHRIIFEQPLNERIRSLLRLEHLFAQADHFCARTSIWDSLGTLHSLIGLLQLSQRADLKTELMKELERFHTSLAAWSGNQSVDQRKLDELLSDFHDINQQLHSLQGLFAQSLRHNEFINSVKQRSTVAGGTANCDLPLLNCWLEQEAQQRVADLKDWLHELSLLRRAMKLVLTLVRESAQSKQVVAVQGFYQQPLDSNVSIQLIRVALPMTTDCFAEISGGKHRITIRFLKNEFNERPSQSNADIEFILSQCVI